MEAALLIIARLLLVLVFAVAGVAKLADRAGSRRAIAGFGVPASLARPFGVLLPLAELAVAAALIPASTVWWGALGALALLLFSSPIPTAVPARRSCRRSAAGSANIPIR